MMAGLAGNELGGAFWIEALSLGTRVLDQLARALVRED